MTWNTNSPAKRDESVMSTSENEALGLYLWRKNPQNLEGNQEFMRLLSINIDTDKADENKNN